MVVSLIALGLCLILLLLDGIDLVRSYMNTNKIKKDDLVSIILLFILIVLVGIQIL
jgi:hypothetical protein